MPNVAGREFPYTPEGLRAAEQYRQLLGMSNGGAMGFRPLGYANGGDIGSVAAAAPPGHFPAYITSDEAEMLRSRGGGVAPDGGQYMANGLPAFMEPSDDGSPGGGVGGVGAPDGGGASPAAGVGVTVAGLPATQATAPAASASVTSLADNPAALPEHMSLEQQMALEDSMTAYPTPVDAHAVQSARNLSVMQELLGKGMISEEAAVAQLGQSIPEGGLGAQSPGGSAAINSEVPSTLAQIAAINAPSANPTVGYAINNPQGTPASLRASQAFAQVNPTLTNVVFGLAGLIPGPAGLVATAAGALEGKGLLSLAEQIGIPGAATLSDAGSALTSGISNAIGNIGTAISDSPIGTAFGNIDFGSNVSAPATATDNSGVGGDPALAVAPVGEPVQSSPEVTTPENGRIFGADNPFFASNPLDFTATNLDPFRFTTSPAVSASGAFKDGGMIGYRPPGYANGGMSDDGTWAPGYANGGAMGFRPLGYANGGMPRGYADGDAVHKQIIQDFNEQLVNQDAAKLSEWIYQRLPSLKEAADENAAFAGQLGDVMNTIGFDKYMEELIAASPPAPGTLPPPSPPQQMPPPMLGQPGQYERQPAQMPQIPQQIPDMPAPMLQQMQQYAPPPVPMGRNVQGMNRGGIMSLRHM